jgi:hypothetical protein
MIRKCRTYSRVRPRTEFLVAENGPREAGFGRVPAVLDDVPPEVLEQLRRRRLVGGLRNNVRAGDLSPESESICQDLILPVELVEHESVSVTMSD